MSDCCLRATDGYFDEAKVLKTLEAYRKKGPQGTTRILIEALKGLELDGSSLLDVGGGIGVVAHELIPQGLAKVVEVEMSSASMTLAREEAKRQDLDDQLSFIHGDLVEVNHSLPVSDLVVLDRVVCCYPSMTPLMEAAVSKSRRWIALSYPRETWYTRLGFRLDNWLRKRRNQAFRAFIHSERGIRELIEKDGFKRLFAKKTLVWNIEVYGRPETA